MKMSLLSLCFALLFIVLPAVEEVFVVGQLPPLLTPNPRPPPPPSPSPPPPPNVRPPPPPNPRPPPPPNPRPPPPPNPRPPPPPSSSPPPPKTRPPPPPSPSPPPPNIRPPPPPKPSRKPRFVKCHSSLFPACYNIKLTCPSACPRTCLANCVTCSPVCSCTSPGAVCMDPRFIGEDGITFYFHGHKDRDFCLVSDPNLHINGHFIGKRRPSLKRDFTWVQSLGLVFDNHKLLVGAMKTSAWDDTEDHLTISLDETQISLPTKENLTWHSPNVPSLSIIRTSMTNGVVIEVLNNFKLTVAVVPITKEESEVHGYDITDEDCFAHLEIGFKFFNLSDKVDGVLGQTYRKNYVSKTRVNVPMPVMGGDHKYLTSGIFETDCAMSRFGLNGDIMIKNDADQYPNMRCSTSMSGEGVVCRR